MWKKAIILWQKQKGVRKFLILRDIIYECPWSCWIETKVMGIYRDVGGNGDVGHPARGPFHKSFCAGVLIPAGLRFTLGVKRNPAKRERNVWFSFIKGIHTSVEACQLGSPLAWNWFPRWREFRQKRKPPVPRQVPLKLKTTLAWTFHATIFGAKI